MSLILASLLVLLLGGLASLAAGRRGQAASVIGAAGCLAGCGLAAAPVIAALAGQVPAELRLPWSVPLGSFLIGLDGLSAFFAAAIVILSALGAVYGTAYLRPYAGRKNLGLAWLFYNVLVASMLLVVVARDGLLFLMAWEVMALASYFLVVFEDEKEHVRQAGWTYLVATHIGTAFLLALFMLMGGVGGSMEFAAFARFASMAPGLCGAAFVLAVVGFGTKAGFVPLHVWLPEAHPAAPSHVSALMSGVMIKTGIYGLLRFLTFLGQAQPWWGWTLVIAGAVGGVGGVLWALAQKDLKRLLAYSSVENIGIITMAIGLGLVGQASHKPGLALAGFAAALLHVMNHAMFKGLLFLAAGSILHGAGTLDLDRLGGLLKRMRGTGAAMLAATAAICGLPPLNGFVSEFVLFSGAFQGVMGGAMMISALVIASLALIGGLAAVCFAKAFGIAMLGEPRSAESASAHEAPAAMRWPVIVLAAMCLAAGLLGPALVTGVSGIAQPLIAPAKGGAGPAAAASAAQATVAPVSSAPLASALLYVTVISVVFALVLGGLVLLRRRLLAGREVAQAGTWDCGYVDPTARMQYTGTSFSLPVVTFFERLLRPRRTLRRPEGLFPQEAEVQTQADDVFARDVYRPALTGVAWLLSKLRWVQHGRIQLYVLYIALTLLALLAWKLG